MKLKIKYYTEKFFLPMPIPNPIPKAIPIPILKFFADADTQIFADA